ncbi:lysylphosphatidylglycerol synthase domain-containing protein [Altererythrobacter lauratis]|uniref:Lysylphosphatidylglycerol synthase domain-containing protein n=1 Tax=Alteraurantiacibacter lauratis TaxID=2054627 RepID=A0ABV7EDY9_9SPHN
MAQTAFLVLSIAAAGWLVAKEGAAILRALERADFLLLGFALLAACANLVLAAWSWRCVVPIGSDRFPISAAARLFLLSQLGKYLPGGIWNFVAAADLARTAGLPRAAIVGSFLLALIIGLGSGAVLALLLIPQAAEQLGLPTWWIGAAFTASVLGLAIFHRIWPLLRARLPIVDRRSLLLATALATAGWICAGAMIWALALAFGGEDSGHVSLALAIGAYAFAWVAGFVAFVAPAGLVVREGALIAGLATAMPLAEASAVALMARVIVTLIDILGAVIAGAVTSRPAEHPTGGYPDQA